MSKPKRKTEPKKTKPALKPVGIKGNSWFEQHFRALALSILFLATLFRIGLLLELPHMPFNQLHRNPELDMNFFDMWGDRIAKGDILTDTIWHPYHYWHKEMANSIGLQTDEEGREKWNIWYGGKQYHQEPLYPLIIGLTKMIYGNGLMLMYILQMLVGLGSIWMIMWLGRHYFGALAGIAAGLLFTLYSPNLLFDATLLRTSFNTCLLIGMIFITEKLIIGKSKPWLMGLIGGAGYLLMTTSMLLWIPLVIRWLYIRREDLKKIWQPVLAFGVVLSFLVFRNMKTESPLLSASSVGPVTYILSNFPQYKPELGFVFFIQAGQIMEKTQGKMLASVLYIISGHPSVWDWVALQFKKLGAVFHWYEIPNNINSYLAEKQSITLKAAFIPYSFIAALGLLGLLLNLKNRKVLNLHIGILSQIAVMVGFYVLCRFRVPMVAMLCIYGGYVIQQIFDSKKVMRTTLLIGGTIALWLLIMRPFPEVPVRYFRGDLSSYFNLYYRPKLDMLTQKGDLAGCAVLFEELLATIPISIMKDGTVRPVTSPQEKDLGHFYGLLYEDLGNIYKDLGNTSKSQESYARSQRLIALKEASN